MTEKQQQRGDPAQIWRIINKYSSLPSVADIRDHGAQLEEIEKRLASLAEDCAGVGASVVPVDISVALGIDKSTVSEWLAGQTRMRDESGKPITVDAEQSRLNDEDKAYIKRRAEVLKRVLGLGEAFAVKAAQAQDNRINGGSLWVSQAIFGYGQEKGREQVTFTLEDLITAANNVKARRQSGGT